MNGQTEPRAQQILAVITAFLALFAIVGFALYGLPRFYPYFVKELGWSRQQVTSGNAYSKVFVAIAFGFLAGRLVDRFGPRRLMLGGIVMAGAALVGLSYVKSLGAFYLFYTFNALGFQTLTIVDTSDNSIQGTDIVAVLAKSGGGGGGGVRRLLPDFGWAHHSHPCTAICCTGQIHVSEHTGNYSIL